MAYCLAQERGWDPRTDISFKPEGSFEALRASVNSGATSGMSALCPSIEQQLWPCENHFVSCKKATLRAWLWAFMCQPSCGRRS
jgi:hypothetical protein